MLKLLLFFLSFFLGSIPFGYIMGKWKGIDIRRYGSGNVGATNIARVLGKKYGLIVFILDALKGAFPVLISRFLSFPFIDVLIVAFLSVLGHCFSPFLGFKGGKGVATSLGAFLIVSPFITGLSFIVFLLVFLATRFVSLSSISAVVSYIILFVSLRSSGIYSDLMVILCATLIVFRHKSNIHRLLSGRELRFK